MLAGKSQTDVTVIGLGPMGFALARALLDAGKQVTVWNRTADKAALLLANGARFAPSIGDAFDASPVVVLVLANHSVSCDMLRKAAVNLRGKVVFNLGAASPGEALELEDLVGRAGGTYLSGTILSYPRQIGLPDAAVLYSGSREAFETHRDMLAAMAGNSAHVGQHVCDAKRFGWPLYLMTFVAQAGFFEGAALARANGIPASDYAELVISRGLPFLADILKDVARRIDTGDFGGAEATLEVEAHAVDGIAGLLADRDISGQCFAAMRNYVHDALGKGYGKNGLSIISTLIARPEKDQDAACEGGMGD